MHPAGCRRAEKQRRPAHHRSARLRSRQFDVDDVEAAAVRGCDFGRDPVLVRNTTFDFSRLPSSLDDDKGDEAIALGI